MICVLTDDLRPEGQIALIKDIKAAGVQVVVVYLGYPRYLEYLSGADAIVLAYCDSAAYEQSLRAVADVLMGAGPLGKRRLDNRIAVKAGEECFYDAREIFRAPAGRLPVDISDQFPAGMAASYDFSVGMKKVEWDFGNGDKGREVRTTYTYPQPGEYTLHLSAVDRNKKELSESFTVSVIE